LNINFGSRVGTEPTEAATSENQTASESQSGTDAVSEKPDSESN